MPLFNPVSFVNNQNIPTTDLEFIDQTSYTKGFSDGASNVNKTSASDTSPVWFTCVSNIGNAEGFIGFESTTSPTNYIVKLLPGGYYETPLGYTDDLFYWSEANEKYVVARFKRSGT
jgi:hypothetical protein